MISKGNAIFLFEFFFVQEVLHHHAIRDVDNIRVDEHENGLQINFCSENRDRYCGDETFDFFLNKKENDSLHYLFCYLLDGNNNVDPNNILHPNKDNLFLFSIGHVVRLENLHSFYCYNNDEDNLSHFGDPGKYSDRECYQHFPFHHYLVKNDNRIVSWDENFHQIIIPF